jgi:hypothetical protein
MGNNLIKVKLQCSECNKKHRMKIYLNNDKFDNQRLRINNSDQIERDTKLFQNYIGIHHKTMKNSRRKHIIKDKVGHTNLHLQSLHGNLISPTLSFIICFLLEFFIVL